MSLFLLRTLNAEFDENPDDHRARRIVFFQKNVKVICHEDILEENYLHRKLLSHLLLKSIWVEIVSIKCPIDFSADTRLPLTWFNKRDKYFSTFLKKGENCNCF